MLSPTGEVRSAPAVLQDQVPEEQVKQIMTKFATFAEVFVALERQYPTYETDLSILTEIQKLAVLSNNPKAARISESLADLDHWVDHQTPLRTVAGHPPRGRSPTGLAARSPHRACRPRGQCWAPTPAHPRPQHVGGGPQQPAQWAGSRGRRSA